MESRTGNVAIGAVSVAFYALVLGAVLPLYPSLYPKLFLAGVLAYVVPAAVAWAASLIASDRITDATLETDGFRVRSRVASVSAVLLTLLFVPAVLYVPDDAAGAAPSSPWAPPPRWA
ncbi:hypothetical protein [Halosimplex sp. J119]